MRENFGDTMVCTFFGHSYAGAQIKPELTEVLRNLIEKENNIKFLVGNHGNFDIMVWEALASLKKEYGHIICYKVLAYMPRSSAQGGENTVFPEGLESVPKRIAILKRNEWMIENSDTVITYVWHSAGGAYKFKEFAKKQGKRIIEL